MNSDTIKGSWKELKGKAQAKWGKLTDDQLDQVEGNRVELAGAIQKSYGVARDEAEKQVKEWEKAQDKAA
jgi:uncharacterized protein YjbJ (UPF0337 family)